MGCNIKSVSSQFYMISNINAIVNPFLLSQENSLREVKKMGWTF